MKRNKRVFSLIHGYSFIFHHNGNEIVAWYSAASGREKVSVNGSLQATQRNYRRKTKTEISIGGDKYTIQLNVKSLLKGPFVCTLYHEEVPLKRQRMVYPNNTLLLCIVYFFIGVVSAKWALIMSNNVGWSIWLFLMPLYCGLFYWLPFWYPYIESEESV